MKNCMTWCVAWVAVTLAAGCESPSPAKQEDAGRPSAAPVVQKTIELGGDVRLEMVMIPTGSFVMGGDGGDDDELPVHKVTLAKPFYLGRYEVTVEQFRRFVEEMGYATDAEKGTGFQGAFGSGAIVVAGPVAKKVLPGQVFRSHDWYRPLCGPADDD
jgi:formylglycine-generating enzyme required for sulfatase activity